MLVGESVTIYLDDYVVCVQSRWEHSVEEEEEEEQEEEEEVEEGVVNLVSMRVSLERKVLVWWWW